MKRILLIALALCAAPSSAADLQELQSNVETRRAGVAGAYLRIPVEDRNRISEPSVGLRLSAVNYRWASSGQHQRASAEVFDLKLHSSRGATLHVAGTELTGRGGTKLNALGTGETIALIVGGIVLVAVVGREILGEALSGE